MNRGCAAECRCLGAVVFFLFLLPADADTDRYDARAPRGGGRSEIEGMTMEDYPVIGVNFFEVGMSSCSDILPRDAPER